MIQNRIFAVNNLLQKSMEKSISGLAFIEVTDSDPIKLCNHWREEAQKCGSASPSVMNLATCTRSGKVTSRNMSVLKFEEDGFIFLTSRNSNKANVIKENPNVASTFLWIYDKEQKRITRQVRMEGILQETGEEVTREVYDKAPLFAKIRSHICHQGEPIEWQFLKSKHDELLNKVIIENRQLAMPEHAVAFKLQPELMDFYFSYDNFIADRVQFKKSKQNVWEYCHIQA